MIQFYYEKYDKIRRKNFHDENQTVVKSNVSLNYQSYMITMYDTVY